MNNGVFTQPDIEALSQHLEPETQALIDQRAAPGAAKGDVAVWDGERYAPSTVTVSPFPVPPAIIGYAVAPGPVPGGTSGAFDFGNITIPYAGRWFVTVQASGWAAITPTKSGFELYVDGAATGIATSLYFNNANEHMTLFPGSGVLTLTAAAHHFQGHNAGANMACDTNDVMTLTYLYVGP